MNKFLRLLVSLGFVAIVAGFPGQVLAVIWLTITDNSSTHSPANPIAGFATTMGTTPGTTTTMPFFTCTTHPCVVNFPNNTIRFRDACGVPPRLPNCPSAPIGLNSQGAARIIKYEDPSTQKIELKGLQITDTLAGPRKVTVSFGTTARDFNPVPAGSYPWAVVLSGTFTKHPQQFLTGPGGLTASCPPTYPTPPAVPACARLRLQINGSDVDLSRPLQIRTVSIPCSNASGYISPCGPGNSYNTDGSFTSTLMGNAWFPATTDPVQQVDVADVNFTAPDQTFAPINSVVMALSRRTEQDFGVENLFYSLADQLGGNYWVYFSAASNSYLPPKEGVTLTSIVSDKSLSPLDQARNDRSYASFIAEPLTLQWQDVRSLALAYDFVVGTFHNLTFSDCANGSFYLRVALVSKDDTDPVEVKIYLGSTDNFRSGCDKAELSGVNLIKERPDDIRVAGGMTINQSQVKYGKLYVRSISVVVDQGGPEPIANYMVRLYNVRVNGIRLAGLIGVPGEPRQIAALPRGKRGTEATKPEQLRAEVPLDLFALRPRNH